MDKNLFFMKQALKEARKAYGKMEAPIGAVLVKDDKIIARGYNLRENKQDCTLHAEMAAIRKACKKLGTWRLEGCDIYVTLEPCPMCAGAIIQSRLRSVFFGAYDKKAGAAGSVLNLFNDYKFNHNVKVTGGLMENECSSVITDFFSMLREKKK